MELKFYVCKHCGNIIAFAKNSGVPVICCGEKMEELIPNTVDAAHEKHVPVITREKNRVTVKIGSIPHPMTEEHFIEWICLHTTQGNQRKCLAPRATNRKPASWFAMMMKSLQLWNTAICTAYGKQMHKHSLKALKKARLTQSNKPLKRMPRRLEIQDNTASFSFFNSLL